jgi:multicomponent Na+:H+ antiporter subunit D
MNALVPLPAVIPLLGAGVSMVIGRWPLAQRLLGLLVMALVLGTGVWLFVAADREGVIVAQEGGWPAPIGITFVADRLAAIMVVIGAAMSLAVLVFAVGQGAEAGAAAVFHPAYLFLAAGVSAAFLTGDLFTLFVAFEVMLTASYVLMTLGARREQVRTGMTYVVVSLTASMLFLTGLGLVYAATGTVNMADLSVRLGDLPGGVRLALGLLFLVVFGIKAAIFPLFAWLPDAYPTAASPVTAIFAGLLTKVGVYAIIRAATLLFGPEGFPSALLLGLAAATMVVGILGAIVQDDIKRVLSFNIVSHVGFMLFGLGLFSLAGLAGAIFYMVHHIVIQTSLFLVEGLIEQEEGSGALHLLGGLLRQSPVVALLFALPALSLAGVPPFSGFVAKLALLQAGVASGQYLVVAASLLASLLTLLSMARVWGSVFWRTPVGRAVGASALEGVAVRGARLDRGEPEERERREPRSLPAMRWATAALVGAGLAIAVLAGPLYGLSQRAAADVLDPNTYRTAVLGR